MSRADKVLNKLSSTLWIQVVVSGLIALVFGRFVAMATQYNNTLYSPQPGYEYSGVIYGALFFLAMLMLIGQRRFDTLTLIAAAVCIMCAIYARTTLLGFQAMDYTLFLKPWNDSFRVLTLREALSTQVGDYNLLYVYFLAIVSRFCEESLLAIKAASAFFDVILAYLAMKLVVLEVKDCRLQIAAFLVVLVSPVVIFNSAQWGQCDSTYVAFCLLAVYGALQNRGRLCAISWTIAFCFKLQAVFMLPALAVAFFMGRIKAKHLLWIPAVYIMTTLPAVFCGRDFLSCFTIYSTQMGEYRKLHLNAPSAWCLFDANMAPYTNTAVFIGIAAVVIFTLLCLSLYKKMDSPYLLKLFFISALIVPYLLPRMHERYFYMAEILSVVYFLCNTRKWYVPIVLNLVTLSTYLQYFFGRPFLSLTWSSIAIMFILAFEVHEFFGELWHITPDRIEVD